MTYINYPNKTFPSAPTWPQPLTPQQPTIVINPHTTVVNQPAPSLGDAFKPKRAGKNTSHIIFVLDDSASMQSCRDATISGFNEYLQAQKTDAEKTGINTFVSLYKFDGSSVKGVFSRIPVNEVEPITTTSYNPQGMTNIYDAIGGVMLNINTQLAAKKKVDRDSIIITILTDGQENASRTFDNKSIKQMVEKAEGKNWGFMFLGANINAFAAGHSLGFSSSSILQYDTKSMASTINAASAKTSRMRSAYASGMDTSEVYLATAFTDQERKVANSSDDK